MSITGCDASALLPSTAMAAMRRLDPAWTAQVESLCRTTVAGALPAKEVALVNLAINASPTHMDEVQIRRHIGEALAHGARPAEVLAVLKLGTAISIHAFATAVPVLQAQGVAPAGPPPRRMPGIESLREHGHFNPAWNAIYHWEPEWLEDMLAVSLAPWKDGVLDACTLELLCIAFDVAVTHMYSPGTDRHVARALQLGVPMAQILEVIKIASVQGLQTVRIALEVLLEEAGQQVPAA